MTFLDWIQRVEKLNPNFEEWQEDETGRLLQKLAAKLNTEVPSEEVINGMEEFAKLQIDDIVQAIEDVYGQLDCMALSVDKQKALQMRESFVENKHVFNIKVYREMLNHKQWFVLRKETNESVSRILLHLYVVYEERVEPRLKSKEYSVNTIIAFQVKAMLTRIALCTWGTMVDMGGINSFMFEYKMPSSKKTKLPLDLYIPIMRRLGMMDILDPDWNTDGEWYEILGESLQKAGDGPIQKIKADEILQRRSTIWRKTRNSFSCRRMAVSPKFIKHLPPTPFSQCFQYFPKCSVNECPNIETRKSPHPIRCKKCWYFHCCSPACKKYAELFHHHLCDLTPSDKALTIKAETEIYLGTGKSASDDLPTSGDKRCNFCSTKEQNLVVSSKLLKCSGCKNSSSGMIFYCGAQCQKWDWTLGGHKNACKKR